MVKKSKEGDLSRFIGSAEEFSFPLCNSCAHAFESGTACEAYPDGIPMEILRGEEDHHFPLPGDKGLQYKPRVEKEKI